MSRGETRWIARWRDLVDSGVRTIGSTDMPWLVLVLGGHATAMPHGTPAAVDAPPDIEVLAAVVGGRIEHCAERVRDANMCS